ncbi:MAG: sensor histidine kinase, partial [Ktedonobacterales bacterium]
MNASSLATLLAYAGATLVGISSLIGVLGLVLAFIDGRRVSVRVWLALAWLATLLVPLLVTLLCVVGYNILRAASQDTYHLSQQQETLALVLIPLLTLALVMMTAAWLTGRTVLRPLALMRAAARQIAGGDLDVALPAPQLYEVAEVASAFDAMSAALRTSIEQQAGAEQQRRLLINAVAHDLRSPIFSLRGHLQGLEHGIADTPDAVLRYIHICQQQADALERLVTDLFAYTRMEYLEELAVREPVELGQLLRQSVDYVRPQAQAKDIALDVCPASEPCPLQGDAHLLARAISNLLDNALRHTPAGGCILVRWERTARGCSFAVEDTGSGFHPEDLPHVFEPLYRGDTSRNRATGGAGLGL